MRRSFGILATVLFICSSCLQAKAAPTSLPISDGNAYTYVESGGGGSTSTLYLSLVTMR